MKIRRRSYASPVRIVYQFNHLAPPDEQFEPGRLAHLVVGNTCRLLDPRRTPLTVIAVKPATGTFLARIDDFEDKGATWEIDFEGVDRYQFAIGSRQADAREIDVYQAAVRTFDRPLVIACDEETRRETAGRIDAARDDALRWLKDHSTFLGAGEPLPAPAARRGSEALGQDIEQYMAERGLAEMERVVAEQYVRNPSSGEIIKGHRIVLAEMGLVPYEGRIVRDPDTFTGAWSRHCRQEHVVRRLAFLRALFTALGMTHVTLFRGMNSTGTIEPPRNHTFTSATFDPAVAQSHYNTGEASGARIFMRQSVPIERLFMTYLETRAMNEHYLEAEAVLMWRAGNSLF